MNNYDNSSDEDINFKKSGKSKYKAETKIVLSPESVSIIVFSN